MIEQTLEFCGHSLHSLAGLYDMKADKELSGKLTSMKFTNPHYSLALESATALAQRGIGETGPSALHTWDKIKVKFPPARDGSPPGSLKTVIMPVGNPND